MTENYLTSITPDSFSGLIFGFEGVKNAVVLLNGPTGCKYYHSSTVDNQCLCQSEFDPLNYSELWYFGQPRVPCTSIDKRDYVYGSRDKLTEALSFIKANVDFELMIVVNSPGTALIGDAIDEIVKETINGVPVITVETPGYSQYVWDGYSKACRCLIDKFLPERGAADSEKKEKKVNILGMSIFHKYYQGDGAELKKALNLCGISVGCVLGCESSIAEIEDMAGASLNIVTDPLYGLEAAEIMKERFGIPYLVCEGLPVGFGGMEKLIKEVCRLTDVSPIPFCEESEKARARSYIYLSRINSLTGLPKGAKFALHGTTSQCLGYAEFFIKYFGMTADSISLIDRGLNENDFNRLTALLRQTSMTSSLEKDILETDAELVFADGNIIGKLKALGRDFSGVEISLPSLGYTDVIPKTHLGPAGGLLLCEQIINGMRY